MFQTIHHIAIIASDYERSKFFYTNVLDFKIAHEYYREERESYKLDLQGNGFQIELFSFPNPPARVSLPEASGLRHLAFSVEDLDRCITYLKTYNIEVEEVRVDPFTNKRFTFFSDPDGLPLELVEC
ncbi:SMU1112c/YaeR family gloxylase I-like metalloprotein [Jeotgalibacillus proteolyticus]|uniref:VOC family protein n=1 Tax=Jeotgalibacillus proteolyticus TaxID=2082395 RepID=A0A2S5G913_9BACL|nr:VOC family protein [Jeotgalibacillus proteolyticus]PPA69492.1 VOC family protein [Jeotgalibacillus proteolyticus]